MKWLGIFLWYLYIYMGEEMFYSVFCFFGKFGYLYNEGDGRVIE